MSLQDATRERLESIIASQDITLFMKGNRQAPQCGFSATVIRILDGLVPDYATVDVLSDPEVREGIKEFSSWPTIPQLYVKGEFVGGCDIIQELFASGELQETLGVEWEAPSVPKIEITPRAVEALNDAARENGGAGREIHMGIDARFQTSLFFAPAGPGELLAESGGVKVYIDPMSAPRADGACIDVVDTDRGPGFHIDLPNAPRVGALAVEDLKAWMDTGESFTLVDVRTAGERDTALIAGSVHLTPEEGERLQQLPKDTRLIFHCHHGPRSQAAAEQFAALGFEDVHNLVGGIDAWSQQIDPSVPRY